jgi:F-type H+-transporting ATPase subunit b
MNGLIDPKLVITQILGFLLMVWVLGRFAWKPMLAALEARRQKIAGEFAEAERRQAAADETKARYEQELRGVDAQARQRLQEAVAEGQRVAAEIHAQAQSEAQARLERNRDEIAREREEAKEVLKEQTVVLAIRTAEKILQSKLDDPAQRKLAAAFIDEVGTLK